MPGVFATRVVGGVRVIVGVDFNGRQQAKVICQSGRLNNDVFAR